MEKLFPKNVVDDILLAILTVILGSNSAKKSYIVTDKRVISLQSHHLLPQKQTLLVMAEAEKDHTCQLYRHCSYFLLSLSELGLFSLNISKAWSIRGIEGLDQMCHSFHPLE